MITPEPPDVIYGVWVVDTDDEESGGYWEWSEDPGDQVSYGCKMEAVEFIFDRQIMISKPIVKTRVRTRK